MGKRIDELPLDDTPISSSSGSGGDRTRDPRATPWYRFVGDIDDLLATGHYTWAESTLRAIQQTVELTERVTDGQRAAVGNIERSRRADGRRPFSRRYEGF